MPQGEAAPQEGGGIADAIVDVDGKLSQLMQAVGQNPQVPDELKQALSAAQEAYRAFAEGISSLAGGQGGGAQPGGAATPEQGANPNAVPESMGRPR
jgi:hypothetical protein